MFIPKRILFEKGSLDYEMGQSIYNTFKDNKNVEVINISGNRVKQHIPGEDTYSYYREGKNTLVVGIKKSFKFQSCKPSAHYQLPLLSGCTGHCEYCYLNTNLSTKPFVKVNVNIDDILNQAKKHIVERSPEITIFEGAATSDPIPVEPYTHSLEKAIEFFANEEKGKFRFVTKYNDVDTLLNIDHKGKTEIRFTLNTNKVINDFENRTSSYDLRLEACEKVAKAKYPIGFIIAPVFLYENWKEDYNELLIKLHDKMPKDLKYPLSFEVITHRYTTRAKNVINEVFPDNTLPMNDEERKYKYGQFGYGKYVYTKEQLEEVKSFFTIKINELFENSVIKYII
ncbi:spore photoproduct lyase [Clostridium botulinum]|uniref:spore photoproduct lyase n=1 Tax=Clostridium botulinum TaxID=1491 RepID=UPI0013F0F4D0|nr:spore photoproduct lyase [Clostridium botulinum]NFG24232.1 spore photoproduct lyase [Clostridium botulinum]NFR14413.1 spore photoproduct lyase [Clostridium botulinum]NFR44787.1 spore photoproduct lyase [Clostridium botulinum]NFS51599.1 spore photoproduct lyase [Clostridium botulinum]UZP01977.1 spore photoproduct lyase [Clostridium botulinum]